MVCAYDAFRTSSTSGRSILNLCTLLNRNSYISLPKCREQYRTLSIAIPIPPTSEARCPSGIGLRSRHRACADLELAAQEPHRCTGPECVRTFCALMTAHLPHRTTLACEHDPYMAIAPIVSKRL